MIKKFLRKNDGLTLVELMVSIAIGTMIFAAATTVLLLGFRIHGKTTDSIEQQYTARMVISMLEQMAENGEFDKVERLNDGSWKLGKKKTVNEHEQFDSVILSYSALDQTIYTGDYSSDTKTAVLENVVASYLILDGKLLNISLEDTNGTYTSTVYCRMINISGGENFKPVKGEDIAGSGQDTGSQNRELFLALLNSQVGTKGGIIDHSKEPNNLIFDKDNKVVGVEIKCACKTYNFFSEWYLGGYTEETKAKGWGPETPWCACFVSWGLINTGLAGPSSDPKWFANVDSFMKYLKTRADEKNAWKAAGSTPVPGDLIFFDMINGSNDNPSHMGVVLSVQGNKITTIEGNSADVVAIREYAINDSRILGYGDPWAAK